MPPPAAARGAPRRGAAPAAGDTDSDEPGDGDGTHGPPATGKWWFVPDAEIRALISEQSQPHGLGAARPRPGARGPGAGRAALGGGAGGAGGRGAARPARGRRARGRPGRRTEAQPEEGLAGARFGDLPPGGAPVLGVAVLRQRRQAAQSGRRRDAREGPAAPLQQRPPA
ncbi:unnamed protein product [Prorocentrum cordatum]|uniref:Uncharacterized protein n=1 Tax=Prorocentrum cordatum TaxID=2364126 RepID=A0ABN9V314_9DINO|nr:unnamed protein product [Polarella glacialis]